MTAGEPARQLGSGCTLAIDPDPPVPDVLALVAAAEQTDGVEPLSEAFLLRLRHPRPEVTHVIARPAGGTAVVGYLAVAPGGDDSSTELAAEAVVHPDHRRQGIGTGLFAGAIERAKVSGRTFHAWSHGDLPAARALARRLGLRRDRILLRMRWSTDGELPPVSVPEEVRLRTFQPGRDDEAWVTLNARAFAGHPEQAHVGLAELHERMAEDWFDPAGFFLAERTSDGALLGFHWTKVHEHPERVGEVYVIGIDPDARGMRLGLTLTVTGLAHLSRLGLPAVILYADESNANAVRMYERLGFGRDRVDVEYAYMPD